MNTNKQHVQIFEIRDNRILNWKKWCKLLQSTYKHEVEKCFTEERIEHEMFVSFELNGKTYGLAYTEGECLPSETKRDVTTIHHTKVGECLKPVSKANVLYNIKLDPMKMYQPCGW